MVRGVAWITDSLAAGAAACAVVTTPALADEARPAPSIAAAPPAGTGPQHAPDTFYIAAYDVIGVTRLLPEAIEKAVYDFTGPDRTGKDVDGARRAIQAAYAAQGYEAVVVDVPPQDTQLFKQGVVQIKVNEAPVGALAVVGAKHHSSRRVLSEMPSLKPGEPLNLKALQAELADANRFPDRSVQPEFKAGKAPGSVDVALKVQDNLPIHASLEINNDHSPSTDPLRIDGSVRLTDLWGLGHSLSATFIVAPTNPSQSTVFSGSYLAPFIGSSWSVLLYGYRSNSNVAALGGTNVLGNGYQIGLRGIYRLPSSAVNQSISFGLDFKDFKQNILIGTTQASSSPITYIPLVAEYTIGGQTEHSQFNLTLGVTAGLRLIKKIVGYDTTSVGCMPPLPACAVDQFDNKALNSTENFVHVNLSGGAQFATKADYVVKLSVSAQLTNSHLVANEQFGLGGLTSVRGYLQSEGVADYGGEGQLELQSPSFATRLAAFIDELRLYSFVDGGYASLYGKVAAGQDNHYALLSVGGGARFKLFNHLTGDVLGGVPLLSGPDSRSGQPRLTFQVKSEF